MLQERLTGITSKYPEHLRRIPQAAWFAALNEYQNNTLTRADLVSMFDLTDTEQQELDQWLLQTQDLANLSQKYILAESLMPGYDNEALKDVLPKPTITGVTWDFAGLQRLAPGSDLWPVTWGDDGHLYTSWGDGGGFGGNNELGRVSNGIARIEGPATNYTTANVNGGYLPENPATWPTGTKGKLTGLICVDGVLYGWVSAENAADPNFYLWQSNDKGITWTRSADSYLGSQFGEMGWINHGQDNSAAFDDYLYTIGRERVSGGQGLFLMRCSKKDPMDFTTHQFWSSKGWTNLAGKEAVITDLNGFGNPSCVYHPIYNQYILTVAHGAWADGLKRLGVYVADKPYGPWATIQYNDNWGGYSSVWLYYHIVPKWIQADGTFYMMFSGDGAFDSFNLIKGTFA